MSRRLIRELAFRILFQVDVGHNPWRESLKRVTESSRLTENDQQFLTFLVGGTIEHLKDVDSEIRQYAQDWKLERMANTDRNILRMAICEIKYQTETPPGVVVNEAVELAKRYGDEESGKFVNGILGALVRNHTANTKNLKPPTTPEPITPKPE